LALSLSCGGKMNILALREIAYALYTELSAMERMSFDPEAHEEEVSKRYSTLTEDQVSIICDEIGEHCLEELTS